MNARRAFPPVVLAVLVPMLATSTVTANVTRHVLPNGVTVIVRESRAAHVVAASLQVDARANQAGPEAAGITNFLHRVMMRGTSRHSSTQLAEAAEDLGGTVDASGDADHGEIRGHALARRWDALLTLMAEVALDPSLPPAEVERERRLILSQIQNREDNPFPLALDTLLRELYGPHPYAHPGVGRRQSIERMARETLAGHYRDLYRPDRLVLAVSGDVDRDQVVRLAGRLLGRMPRRPEPGGRLDVPPAPESSGDRRVVERPAQQAHVLVGYVIPGVKHQDYAAAKVLGAALGGGMSSRLFVELRERRGLAYSLGVLGPSRGGPPFLVGYLGTAVANVEAAEQSMLRELDRIRSDPPNADEVTRAKAYLLGNLTMDRRTNARQAWWLAFFELMGAGWEFADRYARALESVTPADVAAAARRYLERPTTVVLIPPR